MRLIMHFKQICACSEIFPPGGILKAQSFHENHALAFNRSVGL